MNSRCFCWFPAAILVHQNGTPIWRPQTKVYKGAWNVSANNSETVSHKDWEKLFIYYYLLYRHECFTGKYTTLKLHKNYIRDPSGLFSIISHVSLSMTWFRSFPSIIYRCLFVYIIKRTLHGGLKIWILFSRGKNIVLPLENKIHIFAPPCNILYILYYLYYYCLHISLL